MSQTPMYAAVMGEAFNRLAEPIRRFHTFRGRHEFHGIVEIGAPASILARILAVSIGAPLSAARGSIRFELNTGASSEVWTRFFPGKTMRSTFTPSNTHITEHLGASQLTFALTEVDGALEMKLKRMKFLGVPCPAWLMPQIKARESGENDRLNFQVAAVVPFVGTVACYIGYLELPIEDVK